MAGSAPLSSAAGCPCTRCLQVNRCPTASRRGVHARLHYALRSLLVLAACLVLPYRCQSASRGKRISTRAPILEGNPGADHAVSPRAEPHNRRSGGANVSQVLRRCGFVSVGETGSCVTTMCEDFRGCDDVSFEGCRCETARRSSMRWDTARNVGRCSDPSGSGSAADLEQHHYMLDANYLAVAFAPTKTPPIPPSIFSPVRGRTRAVAGTLTMGTRVPMLGDR